MKVAEAAPEQDSSPHIWAILTAVLIVVGLATRFPQGRFVALARMRLDTPQACSTIRTLRAITKPDRTPEARFS
ncbi:hypothetical protein [Brevundimonas sp.]|uniref:hypothetical protein n=1 Tax=Brevundimonas sp. TaxID=1871086 RepID=UPI002EDA21D1